MKKLIGMKGMAATSILLAAAMALSLSVTVSADEYETETDAVMTVTYTVDPSFTVTIPAEVEINSTATVKAEDVVLEEGTALYVTISATSENDDLLIRSSNGTGNETLAYTVTDSSSNSYEVGDTVLTVDPASEDNGSIDLSFALADSETASYSGTYSGTMTFTISLADAQ